MFYDIVQAGASLESLAKGAVQFSRRFTLRELQDRWHSLLYDPITSAEAAERMIEFERSVSNLSSKSNRADNSKENKCGHGKRKIESVRRRYYAMRKKLCNEPLNQGDLSFLVAPGDDCFIGGAGAPGSNNMLVDPVANHFGLEDASFSGLHHVFPQVIGDNAPPCGAGEFQLGQRDTLEVPIDQNTLHRDVPPMLGNNMGMNENYPGIGRMNMPKELTGHNIFDANALDANAACNNKDIMCTDFGGNAIFNSPISDCETSFHHLQYTSTPPAMPDWRPIEDISVPEMPADVSSGGNNVQTGDAFSIPGDGGAAKGASECVDPESNDQMSCSGLRNSTGCTEGYFAELSASLLNFSDEEMLIGRKDVIDKTYFDGLSSLLLNSPGDVNEDKMPNMPETKEPTAPSAYLDNAGGKGPDDANNSGDILLSDGSLQCDTETQMSSCTTNNSQFPEFRDGVIFCSLNTEDPEIPCNDDIVFPSKPRLASAHKRTQNEANNPALASKHNISIQSDDKGPGTMKREPKRYGESHSASETQGPDIGKNHAADELGVKFEAASGESLNGSRNPGSNYAGPSQTSLSVKKESSELAPVRQPGCSNAEKLGQVSDIGHLETGTSGITPDGQASTTIRNQDCHVLGPADPMVTEPGGKSLLSDPEEQFSASDTDIPYFSDIESMVLFRLLWQCMATLYFRYAIFSL